MNTVVSSCTDSGIEGDSDVNEKMTAALSGLIGWKDLQVVLTKKPIDKNGNSLVPDGLDLKVVRHFPLAQVLHAFDAGVCATGYNGVHELLPAQIPTGFVSNIRDRDQECIRYGFPCSQRFQRYRQPLKQLLD